MPRHDDSHEVREGLLAAEVRLRGGPGAGAQAARLLSDLCLRHALASHARCALMEARSRHGPDAQTRSGLPPGVPRNRSEETAALRPLLLSPSSFVWAAETP